MEKNPSLEANSHSGSQEIPRPLLKRKVHYPVHKGTPLVPILNQINQSTSTMFPCDPF